MGLFNFYLFEARSFIRGWGPPHARRRLDRPPYLPTYHTYPHHPRHHHQAKKKEAHQKKKKGQSTERHNPRAFSVANVRRTQKNVQRNLDRAQR